LARCRSAGPLLCHRTQCRAPYGMAGKTPRGGGEGGVGAFGAGSVPGGGTGAVVLSGQIALAGGADLFLSAMDDRLYGVVAVFVPAGHSAFDRALMATARPLGPRAADGLAFLLWDALSGAGVRE